MAHRKPPDPMPPLQSPDQAPGAHVTVGIPTRNRSDMLGRAIESVLRQTHSGFTLIVSDNASTDDTEAVVSSFCDPRLVYRPLERNIGRPQNINRLIEMAETEFLLLLGDDDELHPDHLSLTAEALQRWPTAGLAHAGCLVVDSGGATLDRHRFIKSKRPIVFESGSKLLERSMKSGWTACFSSALFRRAALIEGGGLRLEDGEIDDLPLLMRIATAWDSIYVNRPLATMRSHAEASSSSLGSFTPGGFRSSSALADMLYERRRRFLDDAHLPGAEIERLTRIAKRTRRSDRILHLSTRASTGDGPVTLLMALGAEVRRDHRLALDPITWRFVVGQLGGRRIRDAIQSAPGASSWADHEGRDVPQTPATRG
jgi:glycosyltransferase involved in cell wall biosynthesis